jgi:NAD(P)-dependent dehydrogenase (short-subunit alcohol dehydrogenase family)
MKPGLGKDLTDKVILITGGGTGIGRATAIECAKAGMSVLVTGRRVAPLELVASQIHALGGGCETMSIDVADDGASQAMLDETERVFGRFDAVFANAGYGFEMPVVATSEEQIERLFDVNLLASVLLLREAAVRLMSRKQPGHLLACSSCLGKFTMPRFGLYSATKAGQNMVCRAMRVECRPYGIEVSSVHPIGTVTEFVEVAQEISGEHAGLLQHQPPKPGMFMQTPERVGRAVVKGLRRPRAEIWTSTSTRLFGGMVELVPPFYDLTLRLIDWQARKATK